MMKRLGSAEEVVGVLKRIMERKIVDGLLVPINDGAKTAQRLVTSPALMRGASPFLPVFNVNIAKHLSRWVGTQKKIGALLKPCELRAVVELIKLKQIDADMILLIGIDCYGALSPKDYSDNRDRIGTWPTPETLRSVLETVPARKACGYCAHHMPQAGDIVLGRAGKEFFVAGVSERGKEALREEGLAEGEIKGWEEGLKKLDREGRARREKEFKAIADRLRSPGALEELLAECIACRNCRDVCPVCYCRECFFDKPLNNPSPDEMVMLAGLRDGVDFPFDVLFFHLVRLNHMGISCVGCGMCDDACPKGIPVSLIFQSIGEEIQRTFGYEAGRSLDEPLPLLMFRKEDEEPYKE